MKLPNVVSLLVLLTAVHCAIPQPDMIQNKTVEHDNSSLPIVNREFEQQFLETLDDVKELNHSIHRLDAKIDKLRVNIKFKHMFFAIYLAGGFIVVFCLFCLI